MVDPLKSHIGERVSFTGKFARISKSDDVYPIQTIEFKELVIVETGERIRCNVCLNLTKGFRNVPFLLPVRIGFTAEVKPNLTGLKPFSSGKKNLNKEYDYLLRRPKDIKCLDPKLARRFAEVRKYKEE